MTTPISPRSRCAPEQMALYKKALQAVNDYRAQPHALVGDGCADRGTGGGLLHAFRRFRSVLPRRLPGRIRQDDGGGEAARKTHDVRGGRCGFTVRRRETDLSFSIEGIPSDLPARVIPSTIRTANVLAAAGEGFDPKVAIRFCPSVYDGQKFAFYMSLNLSMNGRINEGARGECGAHSDAQPHARYGPRRALCGRVFD